ncbi:MAG: DUF3857 domain-containing protein [Bryobacter sp.]|nr:DUF3857 domain-containing protein [Bryobacter sp.]
MLNFVLLLLATCSAGFAAVPAWVSEFATASHPAYPGKTKAVVLFNEEKVIAEATGRQVTQIRKVIKILTADGRREAMGAFTYDQAGSKVREARAYLLYPSGKTKEFNRKEFIEGESNSGLYLYSSRKFLRLDGSKEADPGSVFAYEVTMEEKRVFSQFYFLLQDDLPTLKSRFHLTIPAGWSVLAKAYGGARAESEQSGDTYTWEATNLPPWDSEPSSPGLWSQLPRLAIGMLPPTGAAVSPTDPVACFRTWKDVSLWKSALAAPQVTVTDAVKSKALELTSSHTDTLAKIRALGEYVQKIRYVAISTNSARGGGYVPHRADEVLKAAYGDCKDKANLLRALLKSIGLESWPVAIYSGDSRFTQEDFPSPHQFNHAILAIAVPKETNLPATVDDADLGRLLIFDPTDAYVAFGYLPTHEQGAWALLTADEKGKLIRMPQAAEGTNRVERTWTMSLQADGSLAGQLVEKTWGQDAFDNRQQSEDSGEQNYRKALERWLSNAVPGMAIEKLEYRFDPQANTFDTHLRFTAPSYAKVMRGKLWMVRGAPMPYFGTPNVNQSERTQPLLVRERHFHETLTWAFPAQLKIDEVPENESAERPYGRFATTWKAEDGAMRLERTLALKETLLPPADYAAARSFFGQFRAAEAAPVVLLAR